MPEGTDPDDYIKEYGKNGLLKLLKDKEIIQSFIWNYHLTKIDKNNPYEISKFEKDIKNLSYSIRDETLKKYVLEDYLEKINKLTPNQSSIRNNKYFSFNKKKKFKILNETKVIHEKKQNFLRIQLIEFSILYIMLNFNQIVSKEIEELGDIEFTSEKNEELKNLIITSSADGRNFEKLLIDINLKYENLIREINENSNIQIIIRDKSEEEILTILEDLKLDFKEQYNLKKIENLEKKLINNLDENSYSELIKLKNQINRE